VGIAVDPDQIPLDSPALQGLVRANKRALRTIAEQPPWPSTTSRRFSTG
jgi:hypothetical protein